MTSQLDQVVQPESTQVTFSVSSATPSEGYEYLLTEFTRSVGEEINRDYRFWIHPALAKAKEVIYQKSLSPEDVQDILQLEGDDERKIEALYAFCLVAIAYGNADLDQLNEVISKVGGLSKDQAIRFFSFLPYVLTPKKLWPDCAEEAEELAVMNGFYSGVSLWLMNSERDNRYTRQLEDLLGLGAEYKRAKVCKERYDICEYLQELSAKSFFREMPVPLMWLLVEISMCRRDISDSYKSDTAQKERCRRMSSFWKKLSYVDGGKEDEPTQRGPIYGMEQLEHFRGLFITEGRELAKDNNTFKEVWSNYLKLERSWGSYSRDNISGKTMLSYV